ncbi:hypothetical protein [Nocardiopsis alkaliphila]|uniref:hypothetical protein n=1 Tax=Nocardiopsis alkaliphila TaxID=225762 RepID=UPI001377AD6D|nr:hypothetical protein [Nocardiopsis alkaliphila]
MIAVSSSNRMRVRRFGERAGERVENSTIAMVDLDEIFIISVVFQAADSAGE